MFHVKRSRRSQGLEFDLVSVEQFLRGASKWLGAIGVGDPSRLGRSRAMSTENGFEPSTDSRTFLFHVKHSLFDSGGMLTEYRPRSSFAALTYD